MSGQDACWRTGSHGIAAREVDTGAHSLTMKGAQVSVRVVTAQQGTPLHGVSSVPALLAGLSVLPVLNHSSVRVVSIPALPRAPVQHSDKGSKSHGAVCRPLPLH